MTTPELTISDDKLTFARTVPGKPVFLVVRVAADETDVRVTASTDMPDVFQLATDSRPLFGPSLTLTPGSAGTYVHIRYQPLRAGTHQATLLLESAIGSRTVALTGRSNRITALSTDTGKALTRTVVPRQNKPAIGKVLAGLVGVLLLAGLVYGGIAYRCQLMPSLCREPTAATEPDKATTPIETPVQATDRPAPTPEAATVKPAETVPARSVPTQRRTTTRPVVTAEPDGVVSSGIAAVPPQPTVDAGSASGPGSVKTGSSRQVAPRSTQTVRRPAEPARPAKAAGELGESDLERELNGHPE